MRGVQAVAARQEARVPREMRSHPDLPKVVEALSRSYRPLWRESSVEVPVVPFSEGLAAALRRASQKGFLVRGLETASEVLGNEKRGIDRSSSEGGSSAATGISRLIVAATDGSERFYRAVESLLVAHRPRVLAVLAEADAYRFGEEVFRTGRLCRLVLVTRRKAVADVLLALAHAETACGG
ncbi:MAG TPA: hypothetical protein PLS81_09825 [Deltaproteobacteria bacterium]|nr:hypothetical protein [Deltaproteobacteria bacterium]HOM29740.1 hypothetical protein [Deltaproteobacteria bacterium]HPP80599.1 hypothetical protein [Deltaproteobacteria bacterium]